jgi:putative beta-lysine N-acetyltransferase
MADCIETLGNSIFQHGRENDRVYLMKLAPEDSAEVLLRIEELAEQEGYGKIFAKVPKSAREDFLAAGYREEATIPGFYSGREDVAFMGKYLDPARADEQEPALVDEVLEKSRAKAAVNAAPPLSDQYALRALDKDDAEAMAGVFSEVFATYPFPIHDPAYLRQTMDENIRYFGVFDGERLIAISSAETYPADRNAEMTDFATLPECRGAGLALNLLEKMEEEMGAEDYRTLYTIARAYSFGMNITFAKQGYEYSGTLTHNTNISGRLESMNIWYKSL